jgi:hypothetical protein
MVLEGGSATWLHHRCVEQAAEEGRKTITSSSVS